MIESIECRALRSHESAPADLAVFRILFALFVLWRVALGAPWLEGLPDVFFNPPLGLAAVFTGFPAPGVVTALNSVLIVAVTALLLGYRTRAASWVSGFALLAVNTWAYAVGKINHDILLIVTPLVLAGSGWGDRFSLDAQRHPAGGRGEMGNAGRMALLALLIGGAMASAGAMKALTGWLDPSLLCTYGHLVVNSEAVGREPLLASALRGIDAAPFWKTLDVLVVGLELGFAPAALHRRAFMLVLALATLFHLGVMLLFDIPFASNLVTYGAFVPWTRLPGVRGRGKSLPPLLLAAGARPFWLALACALGAVRLLAPSLPAAARYLTDVGVVVAGALIGAVALVRWADRRGIART